MKKSVVEQLQEQRTALLEGTWVQNSPSRPHEACLVEHRMSGPVHNDKLGDLVCMTMQAESLVWQAIGQREEHGEWWRSVGLTHPGQPMCRIWNDQLCTSAGEALSILDEAIRIAKEMEADRG